ncbi:hypothetical protein AVEN_74495-1 [Araneus ventricosus]|uniref:Uncharacterized protein n=1 Tax=Araneus ventricosus TaxID=182803 RepID=A0A4Y2XB88_ARAVE|nr:hypothetical protein AVEN_74495-1 [Araneus ventricosus]
MTLRSFRRINSKRLIYPTKHLMTLVRSDASRNTVDSTKAVPEAIQIYSRFAPLALRQCASITTSRVVVMGTVWFKVPRSLDGKKECFTVEPI